MDTHLPPQWKHRLEALINAHGWETGQFAHQVDRFFEAWAIAEGANSDLEKPTWNPLCCTLELHGATPFNSFVAGGATLHVWNYARPVDGIAATGITLANGHYNGILGDVQNGTKTAEQIVEDRRDQITVWGTRPDTILACLATIP